MTSEPPSVLALVGASSSLPIMMGISCLSMPWSPYFACHPNIMQLGCRLVHGDWAGPHD